MKCINHLGLHNLCSQDRLYEVYPVPGFTDELNAVMQSTYFSFMLELGARTGLGQGLLDLMVYELQRIKIPDLGLLSGITPLNREYMSINEEIASTDRRKLDSIILNRNRAIAEGLAKTVLMNSTNSM